MASILVSNPNPSNNNSTQNRLDDINFPHDIIIDILINLPVKSLLRFKSVCKSWYSLIQDAKFIKQHHDTHKNCQKYFIASCRHNNMNQLDFYHYTMDVLRLDSSSTASLLESPVPIDQLPMFTSIKYFSSNGILLITYGNDIIVMWNPATRESRRIPCPNQNTNSMPLYGHYNFCYFPCIDGYKIFRLGARGVNGDKEMEMDIFSMKGNTWKSIGPFPPNYYFLGTSVVMADGVVYMMARRENLIDITIVRFCLEKEQFQEELLCPFTMEGRRPFLYSLGERLCLSRTLGDNHRSREFWFYMMKTNSWNKIFTITIPHHIFLRPLSFMKDGNMMFQQYKTNTDFKYNSNGEFVTYNSTTQKLEQVNVAGIEAGLYFDKIVTYVETLSSPNS